MMFCIKVVTKVFLCLLTFGKFLLPSNADSCSHTSSDCDQLEAINLSRYKRMLPEEMQNLLPPEPFTVPVKRIHSRHRRFLAPGASWQLKVGWTKIFIYTNATIYLAPFIINYFLLSF